MAGREPFNIRPLIVVYNLGCAGLNLYIGLEIFITSRTIQYSWTCQPVDNNGLQGVVEIIIKLFIVTQRDTFTML